MIAGLDTNGQVIVALLQANSNSSVMELFFCHLIDLLDSKDKGWRKDTIILMDGAPYHLSNDMMEFYRHHRIPIIFTGPHGYQASPIETFFAHLKNSNINP